MSQSIRRLKCPICGSDDVTYNPTAGTITCGSCRNTSSIDVISGSIAYSTRDVSASSLPVAGTEPPETIVGAETEEVVQYRRVRREVFPHTPDELDRLESDINKLKSDVGQLSQKVEELSGIFPKVVVVEEVPKEEAKHKVEEYFKEHGTADIEELMLNLKIPVQTIVEIIDELKREGKISTESEEKT